jgi:hypothetical protein
VEGVVCQAELPVGDALVFVLCGMIFDLVSELTLFVVRVEFRLVSVDTIGVVGDRRADDVPEFRQSGLGPRELVVGIGSLYLELERPIEFPVVRVATRLEIRVVDGLACHTHSLPAIAITAGASRFFPVSDSSQQ